MIPDTSLEAYASIKDVAANLREVTFEAIKRTGSTGATCDELVEAGVLVRHQTASARLNELLNSGRIQDSGMRRRTSSGRTARVYVVHG
jgi:hypothetical protein